MFALSLDWEKEFFTPSVTCRTGTLSMLIVARTMMANLMKLHRVRIKMLPLDYPVINCMSGPISLRTCEVLGPISRYRLADTLPHMKLVSRASRPGLTVGVLSHPL